MSRSDEHPTCCLCIPIRLGVFLNAAFTIITSTLLILSKRHTEHYMRLINGGYVLESKVIIGFLELTGALWGIIGMIGTWQQRAVYVRIYNYFQMVRVVSWSFMFYIDIPVLMKCEMWQTDINQALKEQGWNPTMYEIALGGNCVKERTLFFILSFSAFFFFIYLTYINTKLQEMLQNEPKYLLRIPKDLPMGAFYTQSLGERSALLTEEKRNQMVGPPIRTGFEPGRQPPPNVSHPGAGQGPIVGNPMLMGDHGRHNQGANMWPIQ